jgi:hypothetical protein
MQFINIIIFYIKIPIKSSVSLNVAIIFLRFDIIVAHEHSGKFIKGEHFCKCTNHENLPNYFYKEHR